MLEQAHPFTGNCAAVSLRLPYWRSQDLRSDAAPGTAVTSEAWRTWLARLQAAHDPSLRVDWRFLLFLMILLHGSVPS